MRVVELPIDYAESVHQVLENHVSMGFAMVSQEIKDVVTDEAYKMLTEIFWKYHNANCGPFNRTLKRLINEAKTKKGSL